MITRLLVAWIRLVLAHRPLFLAGIALITLLAGLSLTQARVSTSMTSLFLDETNPVYTDYRDNVAKFGNDNIVIVGVEGANPLEPDNLARLDRLHEQIEAIPEVARVTSVANVDRVVSRDGEMSVLSLADEARTDGADPDAMLRDLATDDLTGGMLVSEDGRSFVVLVELTFDETRAVEQGAEVIEQIFGLFEEEGFPPKRLRRAGLMVTMAEVIDQSFLNLYRLFPFVLVILLLVVYVMFGRLWPVAVTSFTAAITMVWTMGFSVALHDELHILLTVVPGVILIIAFSDLVHLLSAYLLELAEGHSKEDAIVRSGVDVGEACLMTSATTFVGFIALTFVPTPVFVHFGYVVGFGVIAAFVLAVTLVPIILSYMKAPTAWQTGWSSAVQSSLSRALERACDLSVHRPWLVIAGFAVLIAVAAAGAAQITWSAELSGRLSGDNRIRVDQRWFEDHFAGTATLDMRIDAPEQDGILEADLFNAMARLEQRLEADSDIERVGSLVDLVRQAWRALLGPSPSQAFLPLTTPQVHQLMLLVEDRPEGALSPIIDFRRQSTRMTLNTNVREMQASFALGERVKAIAVEELPEGAEVTVYGSRYMVGSWVKEVLAGQRTGVLFSIVVITFMMMLGLRSISAGLLSLIPNLLPLLVLAGYCGWFWESTDTDTLIIAMIAVGIGVDDTIHFLSRLRLEGMRGGTIDEQLQRTFRFAGRGIVITSVIFGLGFLPFSPSDYFTIAIFGSFLPLCFVVALLADLMLVPAMVRVGIIRFRQGSVRTPRGAPSS